MKIESELQLEPPPLFQSNTTPSDTDPLLENKTTSSSSSSSSIETINNDHHQQKRQQHNGDIEADEASAPCCRICLEHNGVPDKDLISPCMCKGTQQFVHRFCLDTWRSKKEGFAFSHCTTCKAQFHLRVEKQDISWRKLKFRFYVTRDVFLMFLAVQVVISLLGGFAFLMDRNGNFRSSFSDGWDRFLSKHPIPFYYCIGVVVFFAIVGFVGLIIHCTSSNCNPNSSISGPCYCVGDSSPASAEACFAVAIIIVVVFAMIGIAVGFFAATVAIQKIWQRHYHILTKIELTKEYVVVDLGGCYTPPKLDPEHEERLKLLKLL